MNEQPLNKSVLVSYPAYDQERLSNLLQQALRGLNRKIVVLDDDPTGVQTVHGVYVYTGWSEESIRAGFEAPESMFFILTNSRSFDRERTAQVHQVIARRLLKISRETGKDFLLISRSDSTLRGHYPLETQALRETTEKESGRKVDGEILMPFFLEGGRYTIGNVHYVASGDVLVPAGQTEFARDKTFGYQASDLREWIAEKHAGAVKPEDVICISLAELRGMRLDGVREKLLGATGFQKIIVNAIDYPDVEAFALALVQVLEMGRTFLFRSAAALTRVLGGVSSRDVLSREELTDPGNKNGGLILIGSHVQRTTQQLEELRKADFITFAEFNQHLALDPARLSAEKERVTALVEREIRAGRTVAVYTRRERLDLGSADREEELKLSVHISDAVAGIAAGLHTRPGFIIAKGGITSSDVGVKGLGVQKALVVGQILKGVPVWLTGPESKFPRMPYVIFPGNVGDENALYDAVMKLKP